MGKCQGTACRANARARRVTVAVCMTVVTVAGCTRGGSSPPAQTGPEPAVPTSVAVSTTVPWQPGEETAAWDRFVSSYAALDVSEVSVGECGPRAMMVTEQSLTMYWWDGERWNDDSMSLAGGKGRYPLKVHTHDYTNDGVLDFFVVYADPDRPRTRTYGAFFAYPWASEDACKWGWVDVDNGRNTTKLLQSPEVDPNNGRVRGPGFTRRRTSATGAYEYLPSTGSFTFVEPAKD